MDSLLIFQGIVDEQLGVLTGHFRTLGGAIVAQCEEWVRQALPSGPLHSLRAIATRESGYSYHLVRMCACHIPPK